MTANAGNAEIVRTSKTVVRAGGSVGSKGVRRTDQRNTAARFLRIALIGRSSAKRAGHGVMGIEPDSTAAAHARALVGEDAVRHGLMKEDTLDDRSVDVISTLDVLEHISADALTDWARLIFRKLRHEGLWVIKVPSTEGLYFRIAHWVIAIWRPLAVGVVKRLWQTDYEYPHTVYFNQLTLKRYLVKNGFEPLAWIYLQDVPNRTVMDRLMMDETIPRWLAPLIAPAFYIINLVDSLRGISDALLTVARRTDVTQQSHEWTTDRQD